MARILVNGLWYEQVEPNSLAETQFEDKVNLHAPNVYPDHFVLPFKLIVASEYGPAKPDLVFVAKDYSEWRVIEVEMGYHNLLTHVEPQILSLANGKYEDKHIDYICNKCPDAIDREKLSSLVLNYPPNVLVIINESKKDWEINIKKKKANITVFELFRANDGSEIFLVDGEYPSLIINSVTRCNFHPTIPRLLGLENPEKLNIPPHGRINLRFNNCLTEWERIDGVGKVWLAPVNRNPLNIDKCYEIHRQSDDSLILLER